VYGIVGDNIDLFYSNWSSKDKV